MSSQVKMENVFEAVNFKKVEFTEEVVWECALCIQLT